jgi:hypothetical protein
VLFWKIEGFGDLLAGKDGSVFREEEEKVNTPLE